ncbi:hypothetical protein PG987_003113 [Apiospora arundinis]
MDSSLPNSPHWFDVVYLRTHDQTLCSPATTPSPILSRSPLGRAWNSDETYHLYIGDEVAKCLHSLKNPCIFMVNTLSYDRKHWATIYVEYFGQTPEFPQKRQFLQICERVCAEQGTYVVEPILNRVEPLAAGNLLAPHGIPASLLPPLFVWYDYCIAMSIHGNWNFLHSFQNGSTIPIAYDSDVPESWKDTEEEYTHYLRAFARRSAWKAASSGRQGELYIWGPVSKDTNAARVFIHVYHPSAVPPQQRDWPFNISERIKIVQRYATGWVFDQAAEHRTAVGASKMLPVDHGDEDAPGEPE